MGAEADQWASLKYLQAAKRAAARPSRERLERLAARLVVFGFDGAGEEAPAAARALIARGAGGAILFGRNVAGPEQVARLCASLKLAAAGRPGAPPGGLLTLVDQEGGRVARLGPPFTAVPAARALGAAAEPERAAAAAGRVIGRELRAVNVDVDLAPVLDVDTNPANPVIGARAFSGDAPRVARMGAAFVAALQAEGVAACGKHFPGHGDTAVDSHLALPTVPHGPDRLRAVELVPFAAAVRAGVAAVLVAHVAVPALDPGGRGRPASLSPPVVRLLRGELGFDGVIVADDLEMGAVTEGGRAVAAAVVQGLQAGVDLFLVCHTERLQHAAIDAIVEAVAAGEVALETLTRAHARVTRLMEAFCRPPHPRRPLAVVGAKQHRDQILQVLRAGGQGGDGGEGA